ncbi:CHAT domain-containing protein [Scleroderma citrinum]
MNTLVGLADDLYACFEHQGKSSDLSLAITHYRSASTVASSSPFHSDDARSKVLGNLANVLAIRFQREGDITDLSQSIECHVAALEFRPRGHPGRASTLANYATALLMRYGKLGVSADIELAIEHLQAALESLPPRDPSRLMPSMNYASALFSRFQCTGSIPDLNQAIGQYHTIVDICPAENKATACYNLANALLSRFKICDDPVDLDSSVEYSCIALRALEEGHLDHPLIITCLATGLVRRFELRGDTKDLEFSIKNFQIALELRPPGNPTRFSALNDLADTLIMRYSLHMGLPDLDLAIDHYCAALRVLPPKHRDEGMLLNNLGNALFIRLTRLGDLNDLEEAIEKHRLALNHYTAESDRLVFTLEALATCYDMRFERLGDPADIHSAVHYFNEALLHVPSDHPHYVAILNSIASSLGSRFKVYGETTDLDRAISHSREVLELIHPAHPDRASTLHTISGALLHRFDERGNEFDLHQAYIYCNTSLYMRQSHDSERASSELLFSRILRARFLPWHEAKDLEPIFHHLQCAKELCPADHSLLLEIYAELSTMHFLKYLLTNQPSELKEAMGHHELSLTFTGGTSIPAFRASIQWVRDAEVHNHSSGVYAYQTSIRLLDRLALVMRSFELKQCLVARSGMTLAVDAAACALRFHQPAEAVELLEQGRGIVWGQLVRVMTMLDDLRATGEQGVALANKFERLNEELESVPRISSVTSKNCRSLLKDREAVIEQIRQKQGFADFLVQPLFCQLQRAAHEGPVIMVNSSQYSCDAIIIWRTGLPVHVRLPGVSLKDVSLMASKFDELTRDSAAMPYDKTRENRLARLLSDLWDQVVYPIVQQLMPRTPRGSRLWWYPTGKFASIPLHAAGPYHKGEPPLSHVYTSSYTSTLATLVRNRELTVPTPHRRTPLTSSISSFLKCRKKSNPPSSPSPSPLPSPLPLRGLPTTGGVVAIGHPDAQENDHELGFIRNLVPPCVPFKRIEGEDVSTVTVVKTLKEASWVHFTCPAVHDPARPFWTAFKMRDGDLMVYDIARIRLQTDFAFVSACQYVKTDVALVHEPMSLPACLQYIGFKSVIGTLWPVDEEVTRRVLSVFYENALSKATVPLSQIDAARMLDEALRMIEETIPLSQRIAFVHVGV